MARLLRVLRLPFDYVHHAVRGLVVPRFGEPPRVVQGVVRSERRVLLGERRSLRGWELPGGRVAPGERPEQALAREIQEETGLLVEVGRLVGEYRRSGFRPHVALVYECRPLSGEPRPSPETGRVRWFAQGELPETIFPWFRGPLDDALAGHAEPVRRSERLGGSAVLAGLRVDLRTRLRGA